MSDTTRAAAQAALAEAEKVTAVILPEPAPAAQVVALDQAPPAVSEQIRKRMAEIDVSDTNSIVAFGSRAQGELQAISQSMLEGVRNKDLGPAGGALRDIVTAIRGFSSGELDVRRERTLWEKITGRAAPVARFTARFEEVQGQIDRITDDLLKHEHQLLKDIESLDQLYDKTLAFYDELALYIAAGEAKLQELDATLIPEKDRAVQAAAEDRAVMAAQELRDLRAARDDLERRVHDLKLTRQVTMQSLPSIRIVQQNDKALVAKIESTMAHTIPLWRQQLAMAVTIARSAEAGDTLKRATDLTNELLTANAEALQTSTHTIRTQVERGVVDVASVKKANDALIATIDDAVRIADEGKRQRVEAEKQLVACESELKQALVNARSRMQRSPRGNSTP